MIKDEKGFRWHWQNLKEDSPKKWLNGRAWLIKRPRGEVCVQWVLPSGAFDIGMTVGGEDQLQFHFCLFLFALHFNFDEWAWLDKWKAAKGYHAKRINFAIHHSALWWHIWADEDEWNASTPKWRDGCFHIDNFLLGCATYAKVDLLTVSVEIPMPERNYMASLTFYSQTWKRPRWPFTRRRSGSEITIEGRGIPIPGKGENAWDQDEDAMMSLCTPTTTTIEDAIAHCVESVMETRERYGGKDWKPRKEQK